MFGPANRAAGRLIGLRHAPQFFKLRSALRTGVLIHRHTLIMKLRIHADSIRLRLKQSEVRTLEQGGEVSETCPTAPFALTYALRPDPDAAGLTAECDGARLTLRIPAAWLPGWEQDTRVGFASSGGPIELLVEKDWKCSNPASAKDNEDCFDNPVPCG